MALITGTALVAIVWQGAVRIVGSKLAKELVKVGAKHLTKKNFKKSYDFFKGNKKIKTSEKNKILEDLNIVTSKVKKSKVPKKPEVKKPKVPKKKVKKVDTKAADKGAKIVEGVIKPGLFKQTKDAFSKSKIRNIVLPNPLTKPIRSTFTYGTYCIAGTKVKSMMSNEAADAVERVKLENEKIKKDKENKEKKIYKKKTEETTLGEIDINTIVDQEHKWKIDNSGNYVVE